MILFFPNHDVLRLAVASGIVPAEIAQKPARAGFGDNGSLWIQTSAKLAAASQREGKRLGVQTSKSSDVALTIDVSCWLELLPLERDDSPLDALERTPVLFDIPSEDELSRLIVEMLRLGNDRQSYRWLENTKDGNTHRALLRVVGPPYYSLLRALDPMCGAGVAPHAYVEQAAGVWVEVGRRHPLVSRIKPPNGQLLLLRSPRQWLALPDAPFRDIYEAIDFQLPENGIPWQDSPLPNHLRVVPRLLRAGTAEDAELWVLRGEAVEELNRFVQNADDRILGQLVFTVGEKKGQTIVALRVRPSKQPPPVLVFPKEAYKSHLKLPNLFLPVGCLLHPPLRRDVVRKLLAENPSDITWLVLDENGGFTPECLPENVFRPLTDWVDYVLERDREPLQAWMQAMRFDFEPFVCTEERIGKAKKPPSVPKAREPRGAPARQTGAKKNAAETRAVETSATETVENELAAFVGIESAEPSEIEKELRCLEEEFQLLLGTLDDAEHRVLWRRLAEGNARLRKVEDAALCWLHVLWQHDGDNANADAWFRVEAFGGDVTAPELDRLLRQTEPTSADLRALASYLIIADQSDLKSDLLHDRLQEVQRFLEKHERLLPARACWLAWFHLVQLLDGDVLALARARDRLLERLFQFGLRAEEDLPYFLRHDNPSNSQRYRDAREVLSRLLERARQWIEGRTPNSAVTHPEAQTRSYVDLIFSYGLARLAETDESRRLLQQAETVLSRDKPAHRLLCQAFHYRIGQALDGKFSHGPLPAELTKQLEPLRETRKENEPDQVYVVDSLRAVSRILEPEQTVHPYRRVFANSGELERVAAELTDVTDRKDIESRLLSLIKSAPKGGNGQEARVKSLCLALEQAPRVGEEFARHVLNDALAVYDRIPETAESSLLATKHVLLEKGLYVAAHFDCVDPVRALLSRLRDFLTNRDRVLELQDLDRTIAHCFRGLRKLGMREEIPNLLASISAVLLDDESPTALDVRKLIEKPDVLLALLQISAGWFDYGRADLAQPIVRVAREALFTQPMLPLPRTRLACAYAATMGVAPLETMQAGLEELLERLDRLDNMRGMSAFYNQLQLRVVESVVRAVVGDEGVSQVLARRWLDEEEYLVRQRIHRDVRALLRTSGT